MSRNQTYNKEHKPSGFQPVAKMRRLSVFLCIERHIVYTILTYLYIVPPTNFRLAQLNRNAVKK